MTDPTFVQVIDSIDVLKNNGTLADHVTAVYAKCYGGSGSATRGGGLLRLSSDMVDDDVMVFKRTVPGTPTPTVSYWRRDLNGGTPDAYMAGAVGDGAVSAQGALSGTNDLESIQRLLDYLADHLPGRTGSASASIRVGDGVFYVKGMVFLKSFGPHGGEIDGTGATLLGEARDRMSGLPQAVLDLTDCRFLTVRNLQIVGDTDLPPACGIRFGRRADNESAEHMTFVDVGTRGHFLIAGVINVASEQHQSLGCDYANEREGATYGYFGDALNYVAVRANQMGLKCAA